MERGRKMVRRYRVKVNGKEYIVEVEEMSSDSREKERKVEDVPVTKELVKVASSASTPPVSERPKFIEEEPASSEGEKVVKAPMAGIIVRVLVSVGEEVKPGQGLLIFEAMKMENELRSEYAGKVKEILVKEGDAIETGQKLVVIE